MISPKRLSEMIHAVYAAAEDPSVWEIVLEALAEEIKSGMTVLIAVGGPSPGTSVAAAVRADPDAIRLYNEQWAADDPWLRSGHESLTRAGAVVPSQLLVDDRALVGTPFYNDFMQRFDMFHAVVATILSQPGMTAGLSCHYPKRARPRRREDLELMELLTPHIGQALRLHGRLVAEDAGDAASTIALDRATAGFVLADGKGRVIKTNATADAILRRGDTVKMLDGRIVAVSPSADRALQAAMGAATATSTARGTSPGATVRLPRPGRQPSVVTVVPVSAAGRLFGRHGGAVALLIADLDARPRFDHATMQHTFGWTAAESRVALLLLAGLRPREIAEQHELSAETVRSQMKSLFAKSGVRSQSELVRVLMNVAAILSTPLG